MQNMKELLQYLEEILGIWGDLLLLRLQWKKLQLELMWKLYWSKILIEKLKTKKN